MTLSHSIRSRRHLGAIVLALSFAALSGTARGAADCAITFDAAQILPAGMQPQAIAAGDFNGDGKIDLVVANHGSNDVSVMLGAGGGAFLPAVTFPAGAGPTFVGVGDFNADGDLDIAVADLEGSTVSILLGRGDGTFESAVAFPTGAAPSSLAVADFNRDGRLDVATADFGSSSVSILLGRGDGGFDPARTAALEGGPIGVVAGDFNGDGRLDLVASVYGNPSLRIDVLLGNGDGTFQPPRGSVAGDGPFYLATGDFDGDGKLDLAVPDALSNSFSILLGEGDGTFGSPNVYPTGEQPRSLAPADFDGDGRLDLIVANTNGAVVQLYRGNGDGTFGEGVTYATGETPFVVIAADLDGDGHPDVAASSLYSGATVILNRGDGTLRSAVSYPSEYFAYAIAAADLDQDGLLDLVAVAGGSNAVHAWVYLGAPGGRFLPGVPYPTSGLFSVTTGFFNADAFPDVATASGLSVDVLLGAGDGTLEPAVSYPAGAEVIYRIVVGDFNDDGKQDLATSSSDIFAKNGMVSVLLGNGDGTFQSPIVTPMPDFVLELEAGRFDADANLDLAVANPNGTVRILLGNGDGTFQAPVDYAAGASPVTVAAGDFDGDGVLDLAVGDQFEVGTVDILKGNGDGTFQAPVEIPVPTAVQSVVAADLNGDGVLDILALGAGPAPPRIFVLRGLGNGAFVLDQGVVSGSGPRRAAVGDFDGDGLPDIAAANTGGPWISVLRNVSSVILLDPPTLVAGTNGAPYGIQLTASGGAGPYSFGVVAGAPPPGVTLSPGGFLSGTPTASGDFTFTVKATDQNGCARVRVYTITVYDSNPVASLQGISPGCASAGSSGFTLSVMGEGFVDGSVVRADGADLPTAPISGTVLAAFVPASLLVTPGTHTITVFNPSPGGGISSNPQSLVVGSLTIAPASLPGAGVGTPFSVLLTPAGGTGFYALSVSDGGLPPGLSLDPSGLLSGTPTAGGAFSFTVTATDTRSGCSGTQSYVIAVVGVTSVTAHCGPTAGGTDLTIVGTQFDPAAEVSIGGISVPIVNFTPTSIEVMTPAGDPGSVPDIVVTNPDAATVFAGGFAYDFLDTPPDNPFHDFICEVTRHRIAVGCGEGNYCGDAPVTRAQMAVFLLKARFGADHVPPPATGTVFADVHPGDFAADWIEELASLGITGGCGNGNYCPDAPVTRAEMAVFLLKTLFGSTYPPPDPVGIFADVPPGAFAAAFIEDIFARGITGGCATDPLRYCPDNANLREEMAVFLTKTFLQ